MALGKGTLISIVIVMAILPQSLVLCDKIIEKTAFGKKAADADKAAKREMSGVMVVNGRIRGNITGFVDGMFYGVVKGDVNARVDLGKNTAQAKEKLQDGSGTENVIVVDELGEEEKDVGEE